MVGTTNVLFLLFFQLLCLVPMIGATYTNQDICTTPELYEEHPLLCHMLERHVNDAKSLAEDIKEWAASRGLLVDFPELQTPTESKDEGRPIHFDTLKDGSTKQLPVVFAHGMGDSCFNGGMKNIAKHTADLLGEGVYSTCIPTGKNQAEDTNNGYFLNMDANVDVFAASIRQDPNLSQGFHAIGFSQGNNVIRGYIAKYNEPAVHTFLSVNGVNGGVGAVPYCEPKLVTMKNDKDMTAVGGMCDLLMEQASRRAYTEFSQQHLFQANYWRDPRPVEKDAYSQYCQLAQWGNEGRVYNDTLKDNWSKTKKFIWVLATEDGMVWPKEGEQWGAPDPTNPFRHILPMNETEWYQKDLFGLKTAQEAGKNYFESFVGDHLQFSMDDFDRWVKTYLADKEWTTTTTAAAE